MTFEEWHKDNAKYMEPRDFYAWLAEAFAAGKEAAYAASSAPSQELDLPKVRLDEFLKLIEGKEDFRGIPLMRTEWPMPEKNS